MINAQELARTYIACWNEIDIDRRRAMLETNWCTDAEYVDPMMQGTGRQEIDALIAAVHARFPGHSFTLKEGAVAHNNRLRFSWFLGANGDRAASPIAHGTDFVIVSGDGRIASVTGFLDQVAA
ncbi:MAG: nuclear transport factor 2 family protein [Rhodospirillaceae bacterium]|nr:nuclear transport factor 2 family protein [Rhodospirillaceae bacterium]